MVDYPFTRVEVHLIDGGVIRGQWLTETPARITVKADDGVYYIPYSAIRFIRLQDKTTQEEVSK